MSLIVFVVTVTNDHKLDGLKQDKFFIISSAGQMSEMASVELKSRCQQGCVPSGGSKEEFFPCLFQPLEAAYIPWLVAASL